MFRFQEVIKMTSTTGTHLGYLAYSRFGACWTSVWLWAGVCRQNTCLLLCPSPCFITSPAKMHCVQRGYKTQQIRLHFGLKLIYYMKWPWAFFVQFKLVFYIILLTYSGKIHPIFSSTKLFSRSVYFPFSLCTDYSLWVSALRNVSKG